MNPFDRVPFLVYALSCNVVCHAIFGVSYAMYIVSLFPNDVFDCRKDTIVVAFILFLLIPYATGELLYRLKKGIVQHVSQKLQERMCILGKKVFDILTVCLFFSLSILSIWGVLPWEKETPESIVYATLKMHSLVGTELKFPTGYDIYRVIETPTILIYQNAGKDQVFGTLDDVIFLKERAKDVYIPYNHHSE